MSDGPPPRRVLLGVGSNLGDRAAYLRRALDTLTEGGDVTAVSGVFETEPVGGPDQGAYLNVVVALRSALSPRRILARCQALETDAHRERSVRWGPRTLDVDILWIDGETVDEPDLVVPHPRMRERGFVMVPLAEVAPDVAAGRAADHEGVLRVGEL